MEFTLRNKSTLNNEMYTKRLCGSIACCIDRNIRFIFWTRKPNTITEYFSRYSKFNYSLTLQPNHLAVRKMLG
jgi:hypothetical protein